MNVNFGANTSGFEAGEKSVRKRLRAFERWQKSQSDTPAFNLAGNMKLLTGGAVGAAAAILARKFAELGAGVRKFAEDARSGELSVDELCDKFTRAIPIVGDLHAGLVDFWEAIWPTGADEAATREGLMDKFQGLQERIAPLGEYKKNLKEIEELETKFQAAGMGGMGESFRQLRDLAEGKHQIELGKTMKEEAEAAERALAPLRSLLDDTWEKAQIADMTEREQTLFRIVEAGGTPAQVDWADKLLRRVEEIEAAKKAAEETEKALEKAAHDEENRLEALGRKANEIWENTRRPAEWAAAQIEELNELLSVGAMNADTFGRAMDKIITDAEKAMTRDVAEKQKVGAYEISSKEAYSVAVGFERSAKIERLDKLAEDQLAEVRALVAEARTQTQLARDALSRVGGA